MNEVLAVPVKVIAPVAGFTVAVPLAGGVTMATLAGLMALSGSVSLVRT
ncbi:MAG TPA: hypothetical protein VKJ01_08945 [Candidatus Solibacter sp.]|nr:hypothetical protein [Candidatus Solibacter sp.]